MRTLVLVAALLAAAPAAAQEPETPEALAVAYMDALRSSDWARVAGYMHPDALRDFKEVFTPILALGDSTELRTLFGVSDESAFNALPPADVFSSFMRNVASAGDLGTAMSNAQLEVIGSIPEAGTDVTHVVYRVTMTVMEMSLSKMEVMPVRRALG